MISLNMPKPASGTVCSPTFISQYLILDCPNNVPTFL